MRSPLQAAWTSPLNASSSFFSPPPQPAAARVSRRAQSATMSAVRVRFIGRERNATDRHAPVGLSRRLSGDGDGSASGTGMRACPFRPMYAAMARMPMDAPAMERSETAKKRILFVDDEAHVLAGLNAALHSRSGDWTMVFAQGGEAALEQIAVAPFDVVVSDMRMPGMSGAELLQLIRKRHPETVRLV